MVRVTMENEEQEQSRKQEKESEETVDQTKPNSQPKCPEIAIAELKIEKSGEISHETEPKNQLKCPKTALEERRMGESDHTKPKIHPNCSEPVTEEAIMEISQAESDSRHKISKTVTQEPKTEIPEEDTFKKPVFISWTQRQRSKSAKDVQQKDVDEVEDEGLETGRTLSSISPAQQLVEKSVPVPYKEPAWSGLPPAKYSFEVLKSGTIVEEIPLTRPFTVLGRLQQCDIVMQHPSLSRHHCVVQYRAEGSSEQPRGFYAYDLGSTHGSYHNKHRMKPHTYYRLHVGHMLKLAGSTRTLILQGPEEDQEEETAETATELMEAAAARKKKLDQLESGEIEEEDRDRRRQEDPKASSEAHSDGIDWGMGDDAVEEEENEEGDAGRENPFAKLNEEIYVADPKKTLRGWMEREGYDLPEYRTEDLGKGTFSCSVDLPVPGPGGGPLAARVEHKGRKKDVVVMCAREACRLLDKMGVLRQATHESLERRKRDWAENDYYDSDEDDFLDRTGDIQRKRQKRMEQAKGGTTAESHDSLLKKYRSVVDELGILEEKLAAVEAFKSASMGSGPIRGGDAEDDLDSFMNRLKADVPDKHKRVMWKLRVIELRKEELKLRRLTNVARPMGVPEIQPYQPKSEGAGTKPPQGERDQGRSGKLAARVPTPASQSKEPTYQVHKIFMEEEPEHKVRLRRLDDDDSDLPKPQPYWKKDAKKRELRKWPYSTAGMRTGGNNSSLTSAVQSQSSLSNSSLQSQSPLSNTTMQPLSTTTTTQSQPSPTTTTTQSQPPQPITTLETYAVSSPVDSHSHLSRERTLKNEGSKKIGSERSQVRHGETLEHHLSEDLSQSSIKADIGEEICVGNDSLSVRTGRALNSYIKGASTGGSKVMNVSGTFSSDSKGDLGRCDEVLNGREGASGSKGASIGCTEALVVGKGASLNSKGICINEAASGDDGFDTTEEKQSPEKRPSLDTKEGNASKKTRILGPTLPPHLAHLGSEQKDYKKVKKKAGKHPKYDEDDPNYDTWVPPDHQTGDGRTALNQKFGY